MIHDRETVDPVHAELSPRAETRPRWSVLGIANIALRRWPIFVILPAVAYAVGTIMSFVNMDTEPKYTSTSKFFTKSGGSSGQQAVPGMIGQLLGQAGAGNPSGGGPDLWNAILRSTDFTRELTATKFRVRTEDSTRVLEGTIAKLYGFPGDSASEAKRSAALLKSKIDIHLGSDRGGLVTLTTTARMQDLAVQLNYRVLELIEKYDTRLRRNNISVERRFIEERMAAVSDQLSRAEADLAQFIKSNRQFGNSPELTVEHGRLEGRVSLYQGILNTLTASNEQQRMEEARNTPVITMFDRPENDIVPSIPTRPQTQGLLGLMLGFAAAIVIVFGVEVLKLVPKQDPAEYERFRVLWQSVTHTVVPNRVLNLWHRGNGGSTEKRGGIPPTETSTSGKPTTNPHRLDG